MERTKKISGQTLAVAILSLLLIMSLVLTATGAWFVDSDSDTETGHSFGRISLADIGTSTMTVGMDEASGDVLMPNDTVTVNFSLENTGTADMFVKFNIAFSIDGVIDESVFEQDIQTAAGLSTDDWAVTYNASTGTEFIYKHALVADQGALVDPDTTPDSGDEYYATANSTALPVNFVLTIDDMLNQGTYEDADVEIVLTVNAVQVANNGTWDTATWTNA